MADSPTGRTGYLQHTDATSADLATLIDNDNEHWDDLIGESVTNASSLPTSGNWPGRTITVTSEKRLYLNPAGDGNWQKVGSTRLGSSQSLAPVTIASAATWVDILSKTVTTHGGLLVVDWTGLIGNAGSGSTRAVLAQVVLDGTAFGPTDLGWEIPNGSPFRVQAGWEHETSPSAGSHTIKLQGQCATANATAFYSAQMSLVEF